MALLSQLAGQIITVLCVTALVEQLLPYSGTTLRYVRIFTGLFVLVSLLNPLLLSFNLWEQSLPALNTAWSSTYRDKTDRVLEPLQQSILLPEYILENLSNQAGNRISKAEVILEEQILKEVNLWVQQQPADSINEDQSSQQQEAMRVALIDILGINLQLEQIKLIKTEAK